MAKLCEIFNLSLTARELEQSFKGFIKEAEIFFIEFLLAERQLNHFNNSLWVFFHCGCVWFRSFANESFAHEKAPEKIVSKNGFNEQFKVNYLQSNSFSKKDTANNLASTI